MQEFSKLQLKSGRKVPPTDSQSRPVEKIRQEIKRNG